MTPHDDLDVSRRELIIGGTASVAGAMVSSIAKGQSPSSNVTEKISKANVALRVNGKSHTLNLDTRTTLLDTLREHLHLTGSKKGCDQGQCGACTVIINGRRSLSCLTLAIMHDGSEVTTIEGLGTPEKMHPMQAAFVKHDGFQCGYCTPGQICSAVGMLNEIKAGIPSHVTGDLTKASQLTAVEIRERMSGNLCRCGAYPNIVDAITEVAGGKT